MSATSHWRNASDWLATPLGRYVLERDQAYFDKAVADVFEIGRASCRERVYVLV